MSPCIPNPGKGKNPYGSKVCPSGRRAGWHVYTWEMAHGPVPDGMFVCHRCDNPKCIELTHLFLGTHADNMQDMLKKGRARKREYDYAQLLAGWQAMQPVTMREAAQRLGCSVRTLYHARGI